MNSALRFMTETAVSQGATERERFKDTSVPAALPAPRRPTHMIKAIYFFCGAGGLPRGLLDAGIAVAAGLDNDRRLRQTYQANNTPSRFIADDIAAVNIHELRAGMDINPEDAVLYAASPPASPFLSSTPQKARMPAALCS